MPAVEMELKEQQKKKLVDAIERRELEINKAFLCIAHQIN